MKRRYQRVSTIELEGGFGVALDEKPLSTPMRRTIAVPPHALAAAITQEWLAQGTVNGMKEGMLRLGYEPAPID